RPSSFGEHGRSARSAIDGLQHDWVSGSTAGRWRRKSVSGDQRTSGHLRHSARTRAELRHAVVAGDFHVMRSGRLGVCASGTFVFAQTVEGQPREAGIRESVSAKEKLEPQSAQGNTEKFNRGTR